MTTHQIQHKQQGMTLISLVIMYAFIGFLLLAVLRLLPLYYENNAVQSALASFSEEYKGNPTMTVGTMREKLQRRLDVQDVTNLKVKDITIKKSRNG